MRLRLAHLVALALPLLLAPAANAQRRVTGQGVAHLGATGALILSGATAHGVISALVEVPMSTSELELYSLGLRPIVPGIASLVGDADTIAGFARGHTSFPMEVAPPLRPKLDLAVPFIGASWAKLPSPLDGTGVYVGVVDTGIDIFHVDFRHADGTTRIAWLLDLSQKPREGSTDQTYGGRVFDRAEIDALIAIGPKAAGVPDDVEGHGTHVTGIAAAGGGTDKKFAGVAPNADLLIVRAARNAGGDIFEADAVIGTKFVFDMAKKDARPAVVNLSIGSQFGPHDGTSTFERGLTALAVGPGRAVVVAASNEGGVAIHTSLRVSKGSTVRIPVAMRGADGKGAPYRSAQVYTWLNWRDGGEISVGLEGPDGTEWMAPVSAGGSFKQNAPGGAEVVIINDRVDPDPAKSTIPAGTHGAAVIFRGPLPLGDYQLVLSGDSAVEAWLQGAGDAGDGPGMPVFARGGQIEGTIGIPASAAGLISIGCVYHRTEYRDRLLRSYRPTVPSPTALDKLVSPPIGERCYFSSAGGAADGSLRPDVMAPGFFVISSLARTAFQQAPNGEFSNEQVIDPEHGALAGTSMSSPFGAGAVALLFQRDPTLTQEGARAALMAGARPLADDDGPPYALRDYAKGAGILDVHGSIASLDRKASPPAAVSMQLRLGASYLAADRKLPLWVLAIARDAQGLPADVVGGVRVAIDGAEIAAPLEHPSVGLYRFSLIAAHDAALTTAHLRVSGTGTIATERDVPIAADRWDARIPPRVGGGCAISGVTGGDAQSAGASGAATRAAAALATTLLVTILGRRRSRSREQAGPDRRRAMS